MAFPWRVDDLAKRKGALLIEERLHEEHERPVEARTKAKLYECTAGMCLFERDNPVLNHVRLTGLALKAAICQMAQGKVIYCDEKSEWICRAQEKSNDSEAVLT